MSTHASTTRSTPKSIRLKVRRQESADSAPYWEEYELPYVRGHNVLSALMEVRKNPVTVDGKKVTPVVWESNCLEEVCGACSMVINGKARQGCTALVDQLEQPITIEPLSKFPVVRDLVVDRSRMFNNLKRVKAWIEVDGSYPLGPGPRLDPAIADTRYKLSTCISCGVCLEVCPQVSVENKFVGAAIISQVRLFNMHPVGAYKAGERLDVMMQEGGIQDCGNAQNCVRACPKSIPLTESIAEVGRDATSHTLKKWLGS